LQRVSSEEQQRYQQTREEVSTNGKLPCFSVSLFILGSIPRAMLALSLRRSLRRNKKFSRSDPRLHPYVSLRLLFYDCWLSSYMLAVLIALLRLVNIVVALTCFSLWDLLFPVPSPVTILDDFYKVVQYIIKRKKVVYIILMVWNISYFLFIVVVL
jgi:hypothetical protein